jgi:hypothetical protein
MSVGVGEHVGLQRPVLAGGESYRVPISLVQGGSKDLFRPQSMADVVRRFGDAPARMISQAEALTPRQRTDRLIVEAKVLPNFLAASHVEDAAAFWEAADLIPVGSRASRGTHEFRRLEPKLDQPAKTYLLSAAPESIRRMSVLLSGEANPTGRLEKGLTQLDGLRLSGPDTVFVRSTTGEIRTLPDGRVVLEAVIHPQLDPDGDRNEEMTDRVRRQFADLVDELGGRVNEAFRREVNSLIFMPIALPANRISDAAAFGQLRTLRFMPTMREPTPSGEELYRITATPDLPPLTARRVAIFDGGVDTSLATFDGYVTEHDLTPDTPRLAAHVAHGTSVTSAVLFGSLDPAGAPPAMPHTGVDAYRVWPPPADHRYDADLDWVLDRIVEVVEQGNHRVVVISLAPRLNVTDDHEPHRWTVELDRLAAEHNVLFVIAAGNTGDLDPEAGTNRLLIPADATTALSVGACTDPTGDIRRAEYSSVGPGRPGARTAPMGVQFGGNLSASVPFGGLLPGGTVAAQEGTSMAAPVVARSLAELDLALGGGADANLLRAFSIHHAERVDGNAATTAGCTAAEIGYGRLPASFADRLEHRSNEVTVLYRDVVHRDEQARMTIPLPRDLLAELGGRKVRLRWTLSFFSAVEGSNTVDYGQAGLTTVFRPHARRFRFNKGDESRGPFNLDEPNDAVVIAHTEGQGFTRAEHPVSLSKPGWAPEVEQRARDGKWETVIRVDKVFQASSLFDPAVDLHMLAREQGRLVKEADELPFVLIATAIAPAGADLYDRTRQSAVNLTPLSVDVSVHARVTT